jgi:Mrp family chromosome partitioning ATPase
METGGASERPASAAAAGPPAAPPAIPEERAPRFASAPTQEILAYPSAPPAGDVGGFGSRASAEQPIGAAPVSDVDPLGSFVPSPPVETGSGGGVFLAHATRVPTFAEGPLPPGCDELAGLRAALLSRGMGRPPATIMVAGASSEGASSRHVTTGVAVGLAGEFARDLAHQVLLVDANVSAPAAMRMLDVDPALEFADVLEGRAFAGEAMVHSETDNLSALFLRPDPIAGHARVTAESFLSDVARQAMDELQSAFDYVVIDAGDAGSSAAAKVLAARATGTVLVLTRGVSLERASAAKRSVEGGGGRVIGVVLAGGRLTPRGRDPRGGRVTGAFTVPGARSRGSRGW